MRAIERSKAFRLGFSSPGVIGAFRVVNDEVMGGLSTSRLGATGEAMAFEGEVSLANNGGFASCRGPVALPSGSTALLVVLRGDGKRYKLTLRYDDASALPLYQASFVAPLEWQTLRFEPEKFSGSRRGRAVALPRLRLAEVRYLGLLVSDRQPGAFRIELKELRVELRARGR